MPETYFVDCRCGSRVPVELFHAGTDRTCPSCGAAVRVPGSNELKELSGDRYPLLRSIEKVQVTAASGEPPFDGLCHGCSTNRAVYTTPCHLNVMVERQTGDDGGIRPTITGGIDLVASSAEELWQTTTFPLLLCEHCQAQFQSDRTMARVMNAVRLVILSGLLAAFLYFAYHNAELIAAFSGLIWLLGAIAWVARFRDTKKLAPYVSKWVDHIRWVPDAIAGEEEFKFSLGRTATVNDNAARSPTTS